MKYPYHVKANGRYYAPGEEIEGSNEQETKLEQTAESQPPEKPKARRVKKSE